MTDADLLRKKLAHIETCVAELRALARLERLETDVRERRFVERTLQIAIQAALDVASHIVSEERLGEPRTNGELFVLAARGGWLPHDLVPTLRAMAGFRNVVVHGYDDVHVEVVRDVVHNHLGDLERFAELVRVKLAGAGT